MSQMTLTMLLELLEGDREVVELLREVELVTADCESFGADQVECALVARTLLRELEVNAAGVEIILRMRGQLLDMQRQVGALLDELRRRTPTR